MQLKNFFSALCFLVTCAPLFAQDTTAKKPVAAKIKPYGEVITSKAVSQPGFFTVHKVDDKYYFEIPDSLLNRELLATTRLVKVPIGSLKYPGEVVNAKTISFEKGNNKNIFLKVVTLVSMADSTQAIAKAVKNANIDPIVMVFDIKAYGTNNNSTVIDMTDFFMKENNISGIDATAKGLLKIGAVAADRSFMLGMNAYPFNIETKTVKTFSPGGAAPAAGGTEPAPTPEAAASAAAGRTCELSHSIMLMPKTPMQARSYDKRVGYYADAYKVFSDDQQKVEDNIFIVRFKMEPKEEDKKKYKRGELVEPKEPLVYYVDPATPKQWRPYIIAGINDWNIAFEKAGFKNAIVGKEWPEDDTTMSLEDSRYKVVRYVPSVYSFPYEPTIHDPRSGEILQSRVELSHSMLARMHDQYLVQAGAVDPAGRKMKFDEKLMGRLIRSSISNAVGRTLGLRANLGSSTLTPVEKLRDKAWVEKHGLTPSIMDEVSFNYVAQPGDGIGEKGMVPKIGEYDMWAIQWGYRWTDIKSDEDKKIAASLILDSLKANPRLWFGGTSTVPDPRRQEGDLGDNAVKAGEYGMKNLKIVMANMMEWSKEEHDTYENLMGLYDKVCGQFSRYTSQAVAPIGGVYENIKSIEQSGAVYTPVPKAVQKEALAFVNKHVFQHPSWLLDKNVLNKFRKPARQEFPEKLMEGTMSNLVSAQRLYQLTSATMNYGSIAYSAEEMMNDLSKGIWSELTTHQPIEDWRRRVQKKHVNQMLFVLSFVGKTIGEGPTAIDMTNTDIPVVLRAQLESLRAKIIAAIPFYKDELTIAHLKYIEQKIKKKLNGGGDDDSKDMVSL